MFNIHTNRVAVGALYDDALKRNAPFNVSVTVTAPLVVGCVKRSGTVAVPAALVVHGPAGVPMATPDAVVFAEISQPAAGAEISFSLPGVASAGISVPAGMTRLITSMVPSQEPLASAASWVAATS